MAYDLMASIPTSAIQSTSESRQALLRKVIEAYSPSGREGPVAQILFQELSRAGFSPRIDRVGNVVCEIGSGEKSLLFCGHMDTVPGELPVNVDGDVISGRGACDAKGALLSLLFAFEDCTSRSELKSQGRIIFAAVTEEERSSVGLKELIRQGLRADYSIFGEPCGISKITVGYRGHLPTKIMVETDSSHGSAPSLSSNSAEIAFEIYQKLRDSTWPKKSPDKENSVEDVSVALTQIHAGTAHNVTPSSAEMTLDVRIPTGVSSESARASIQSVVSAFLEKKNAKIQVSFSEATEAYRAKIDSKLVRSLSRSMLKSRFSLKPSFVEKSGTGDMNTYAQAFGVEAVTFGPGDTKLSHTTDERISISEVLNCSEVLVGAAEELFRMK